jgi:glycolate oxidase
MAIDLEGTVSGEHGIGLLKKPLLMQEFGAQTMDVFKKIKRAFDPQNQFNPGKIIDL